MKTICQWSLLLGSFALLAGCNQNQAPGYKPEEVKLVNAADVAAGKEENLFPMVRGNQWVYDVDISVMVAGGQQQNRKQVLTFRCTNVLTQGNKIYATLEAVVNDQVNERQQWILEKGKGLYQASVGDPAQLYTPPQPALRFPVKEGNVFRWEGTGFVPEGAVKKATIESTIMKTQEVDTGAGRMQAIPVQAIYKWDTGIAAQTTWWAPGVGIARYRQEVRAVQNSMEKGKPVKREAVAVSVMRLKSMSLIGSE